MTAIVDMAERYQPGYIEIGSITVLFAMSYETAVKPKVKVKI